MSGLWGEEFELPKTQEVVKVIKAKTENKKKERTEEQIMRARAVSIDEKLAVITRNVYRVLGSYASNTQVIYDYEEFKSFIDKAIEKGSIAIDTETNNTLDTTTCKIMGLCLYIDGEKNAYIPVNHVDPHTKEKLPNQITEEQIREQLSRLDNTFTIFHNYQFDYKVIGFTCGIWMHADWDTSIGAKILNENEEAKLKVQYVTHIDPSIERYNINSFFENIQYELVDPKVFSLYAATDAYMTYKLYLYQKEMFEQKDNREMYNLFKTVEMPIARVAANMEKVGVCIDKEYASRLEESYNRRIAEIDKEVEEELRHLEPKIAQWRLTPEANKKPKKAKITKDGNEFGKSKNEQLSDPVKVSSPSQLAILIYDVLRYQPVDKDKPRCTDSDALEELSKQGFKLGDIILKRRGLVKLLNTYITAIPNQVSPRDNRLHAGFNTLGTFTGRYSSSNPNLQNIPSHEKTIRLMFTASPGYTLVGGDFSLINAG